MKKAIFTLMAVLGVFAGIYAQNVVISEISYNPPGPDNYEYIEFYNKGNTAVDMTGWTIDTAITYTFPAFTLAPGEYVVVCNNLMTFEAGFGFQALEWSTQTGNALNNTGEKIVLHNAAGVTMDSVRYASTAPWPTLANGGGPSLVLCDVNSNNADPANWAPALTSTGIIVSNIEILANPGAASNCITGPIVSFIASNINVQENIGSIEVKAIMVNGNANPTSVTLEANVFSTATAPDDYTPAFPITLNFQAGVLTDTQTVILTINDDADIEPGEFLSIDMANPTNGATIVGSGFTINITDNDSPLTGALVITGVYDTQVETMGTWAKGCELQALQDIPDLSIFAVGFANNGQGTDGPEVPLPAISVTAGECIYVANDSTLFANFFGFPATIADTDAGINGDDAIELFENGQVVDVFGEITYAAGSLLAWNYLDGWAYRKDGTGPDGTSFNVNNWNYSGPDVFDLQTTNGTANVPFPVCSYSPIAPTTAIANDDNATTDANVAVVINILGNDVLPNTITAINILTPPANGAVLVNGLIGLSYTPNAGYCGPDSFVYEVCDANGCDDATVNITVVCPTNYEPYDIGEVTEVDANGAPVLLGVTAQLQGIVHGIDYQGVNPQGAPLQALQFYLIDGTGGISVFSNDDFGYTVHEGDEIIVQGEITQFNCLTQISNVDSVWLVSTGNPTVAPAITTFLDEDFESELVELTNLTLVDPSQWLGDGSSFNVTVTNGSTTNIMRIDNDCELSSMAAPTVPFHARGLGGQFDNSTPCDGGYQFFPRYAADIILLLDAKEALLEGKISFYPNPVGNRLFIQSEIVIDEVIVSNAIGQVVGTVQEPGNQIEVGQFQPGLYLITFRAAESTWTGKFVKE